MPFYVPEPGARFTFSYPVRNHFGVPLEYRHRTIIVDEVRDVTHSPLLISDFLKRPMVRRGRTLVIGQDVEIKQERSFYIEAMREIGDPPPMSPLRLGLVDPEEPEDVPELFGPAFYPDTFNRLVMKYAIRKWLRLRRPTHRFLVGVFPVSFVAAPAKKRKTA